MASSLLYVEYELCYILQVKLNLFRKKDILVLLFYFSMMILNSSQQFFRQIPVLTSASLLEMMGEVNRPRQVDPLTEIRNGLI